MKDLQEWLDALSHRGEARGATDVWRHAQTTPPLRYGRSAPTNMWYGFASAFVTVAIVLAVVVISADSGSDNQVQVTKGDDSSAEPKAATAVKDGVSLELTLNRSSIRPGERITADVEILYEGTGSLYWPSSGCRRPVSVHADVTKLLDGGTSLSGDAQLVKEMALSSAGQANFDADVACDAALVVNTLASGERLTDQFAWDAELGGDFPVPPGTATVVTTFEYATTSGDVEASNTESLEVSIDVTVVNSENDFLAPAQILDQALVYQPFADWMASAPIADSTTVQFNYARGAWQLVVAASTDVARIWLMPDSGAVLQLHFGSDPPPDPYPADEQGGPTEALEVPDLRGLDGRDAERQASDLGFSVEVRATGMSDVGIVISQEPDPGSMLLRGGRIQLTLGDDL